jgi:hypothetical protein
MFDTLKSSNDDRKKGIKKIGKRSLCSLHLDGRGRARCLGVLDALLQAVRYLPNGLVSLLVHLFDVGVTVVPFHEDIWALIVVADTASGALVLVDGDFDRHGTAFSHRGL